MVYVEIILEGKIQGGTPLQFLSKKLSGETLCKFFQIFPPKVLVEETFFLDNFFIGIIKFQLSN